MIAAHLSYDWAVAVYLTPTQTHLASSLVTDAHWCAEVFESHSGREVASTGKHLAVHVLHGSKKIARNPREYSSGILSEHGGDCQHLENLDPRELNACNLSSEGKGFTCQDKHSYTGKESS